MIDMEKVIKGLEMCEGQPENCGLFDCPYFNKRCSCEDEMHRDAIALLKDQTAEAEMEGGGSSWWFACGECHGLLGSNDKYCRHCGRRIVWHEQ